MKTEIMYLEECFDILETIETIPKTNDKIKLLEDNKDNIFLCTLLVYAVDERVKFNIKDFSFPETASTNSGKVVNFENFLKLTELLRIGELSGNNAKEFITKFLSECSVKEIKWYVKVLQKDIASTKIGRKIMDDVWPGSVLYWKCGLAEQEDEIDKILEEDQDTFQTKYAYLELKKNGVRTFFESTRVGVVTPVGRSGLPIYNFDILSGEIAQLNLINFMIDGECSVDDNLEDTMTVFGFDFSKTIEDFKGTTGKVKEKAWQKYQDDFARADALRKNLKFTIFAMIPLDEWYNRAPSQTYEEMREHLESDVIPLINTLGISNKVEVIKRFKVNSYIEARDIANMWMEAGYEGAILKSPRHTYPFNRSRNWIKLKEEVETDFQITGYVLQKPKYNGDGSLKSPMIGKFTGHDQANRVYSVGTGKGWNEPFYIEALENFETKYKNRIMKITAQRFTDKAAICPRFDCWRDDKTTLED